MFKRLDKKRLALLSVLVVATLLLYLASAAVNYSNETTHWLEQNTGYMTMSGGWFIGLLIAVIGSYALICGVFTRRFYELDLRRGRDEYVPLYIWIVLAVALRAALAVSFTGYATDMSCFKAWAYRFGQTGPVGFYASDVFCDYPPLYFFFSYLPNLLVQALGISYESALCDLLFKTPAILADILVAVVFYRRAYPRFGHRGAATAAALILFNPMMWMDSALWGQIDGLFMLFVLLSIAALEDDEPVRGGFWYVCALLLKPQALLFGPVLLLWVIHYFVRKKKEAVKPALMTLLVMAAFALAVVLPFSVGQEKGWLLDKYFGTMASYPYASMNALNLFMFFGGNMVGWSLVVLGLTLKTWGWIGVGVSVLLCAAAYWKYRRRDPLAISAAVLLYALYMLGLAMHERYIVPAAVLILYLAWRRRRRVYAYIGAGVSAVAFAAMAGVLRVLHFMDGYPLAVFFTAVNIVLFGFFLYVVFKGEPDAPVSGDAAQEPPHRLRGAREILRDMRDKARARAGRRLFDAPDERVRWSRVDLALILLLTGLYGCVGLTRLGSRDMPQTYWEPTTQESEYIYDFGETVAFSHYNIFEYIGDGSMVVETSDDGVVWTQVGDEWSSAYGKFFAWDRVDVEFSGRYVRLTVTVTGFQIGEIGFFDADGTLVTPTILSAGADDENGFSNTLDEQSVVAERTSYFNSAYFDEVYHARTAYEELHGLAIYEVTHPPLGKDIIMLGIKLFGMNPFGYRIMGAVAGVLMVPAMYVFGRFLFKKRIWAALAAFLMAADFMHYAQTRIATIDSFAVLFIILMYIFMYLYQRRSFYDVPLKKTLAPLALCGVFFGIGAATKWIGLYAGAGLAVLFFRTLYLRFAEYRRAKALLAETGGAEAACSDETDFLFEAEDVPEGGAQSPGGNAAALSGETRARLEHVRDTFKKSALITLLWCLVFFVAVPLTIYCLSYLPYVGTPGQEGNLFEIILRNQAYMFNYHSKYVLEMQTSPHPYQSRWYTWPFIGRPIFYYMGVDLPEGVCEGISSFGNPAIWWFGVFAFGWVVTTAILKRRGELNAAYGERYTDDSRLFLIVALLAQFVPWMLVSRSTYIYHYFATTPFLMLCIVLFFRDFIAYKPESRVRRGIVIGYAVVCAALFALYYPLLTGVPMSSALAEKLRILPGWVLYAYWL